MKLKRLIATGLAAAILSLTAPMVHADPIELDTLSSEYIGVINPDSNPANAAAVLPLLNYLLDPSAGTAVVFDDDSYNRSNNACADITCPDAVLGGVTSGGSGNVDDALGSIYIIQKYGATNSAFHVWDITNVTEEFVTPDQIGDRTDNNWRAFLTSDDNGNGECPDGQTGYPNCQPIPVPEPGTLGLLGLGLLGLAARRRTKV